MTPLLTHAVVGDEKATRTMVFLHGILGSGANWRSFARRLVAARPAWRAVLVDLRKHGTSQDFAPPHTIAACADDVLALEPALGGPIHGLVGHSFGGKVALEVLQKEKAVQVVWSIDSAPGARPARSTRPTGGAPAELRTSEQVVGMLATLPERFDSREAFVDYVMQQGAERPIAMWLAMNVRPSADGGYAMRVDVPALRALLDDFFALDAWPILEDLGRTAEVHMVVGGKSDAYDNADRALALRVSQSSPDRTFLHVIPEAGHWVHVDAPEELFALLLHYL